MKTTPKQIDKSKVVAENDSYIIVKIDIPSELYEYGKGTDWDILRGENISIDIRWKEFSRGSKVYVALKKKLGKPELKRSANLDSVHKRIKIYPYWDKVLIKVDKTGKPTYWNTGDYKFDSPKVELPSFTGMNKWKLRKDGTYDVEGDVVIDDSMLVDGLIPWAFNSVSGNFSLSKCTMLESYANCPKVVYKNFNCATKSIIESLRGCPKIVGGDFNCEGHKSLVTLSGSPHKVVGKFNISRCDNLNSLEGAPFEVGGLYASYMKNLTILEGCPDRIHGDMVCAYNPKLGSVKWLTDDVGGVMDFTGCKLLKLRDLRNRFGYVIPDNFKHELKESFIRWTKKVLLGESLNKNVEQTINPMGYKMNLNESMLKAVDFLVECKVGSTVADIFTEGKKGAKEDKDTDKKKEKEAKALKLAKEKKEKEKKDKKVCKK